MYSEGGGVPGLIQREVNPKLLRVHCLSHRCALVLKDSESVEKSGWEAQPREVWVMIRLKASGSASTSKKPCDAKCQETKFTAGPPGLRRNGGEAGREGEEGGGERERERRGK